MDITQLLNDISAWISGNLAIAVGGTVAVVTLTVVFLMTRKRRETSAEKLAAAAAAAAAAAVATNPHATIEEQSLNWSPPEQSYADRRGAVRRDGTAIRVVLASPTFRNGVTDGFVLDRSTGGLRLAVSTAIAPGTIMQVRAVNAPDTIAFVGVLVRSCRKNGDFYEVGCEFEKTPPWNVLLLFG